MFCIICGAKNNDTALYCIRCGSKIKKRSQSKSKPNVQTYFGNWTIDELIGEGGFAKVYKISKRDFGDNKFTSAMKVIKVPKNESEIHSAMSEGMDQLSVSKYFDNIVSDIIKTIKIMSEFKGNSNIVSYEDHEYVKHADGIGADIFVRMELLTSLLDFEKNHDMDESTVLRLGIDICKALELCSKRNIMHRDVKPENIFVSNNGDFKLGDFGIARNVDAIVTNLSQKGTYSYMAPEVFKGENYNFTVDIYSLGLVLYKYLNNNRLPFFPQEEITYLASQQAIQKRMQGASIPKPVNAKDDIAKVILKACEYDSKNRYSSASDFRIALEKLYNKRNNKSGHSRKNKNLIVSPPNNTSDTNRTDTSTLDIYKTTDANKEN